MPILTLAKGAPAEGRIDCWVLCDDERRLSYFGRLQYDYKGKYLLSAMLTTRCFN